MGKRGVFLQVFTSFYKIGRYIIYYGTVGVNLGDENKICPIFAPGFLKIDYRVGKGQNYF